MTARLLKVLALATLLAAAHCSPGEKREPEPVLANGCAAVEVRGTGLFLSATSNDGYEPREASPEGAEHFFIKPTGLGTVLLTDRAGRYLAASDSLIHRQAGANERAEWRLDGLDLFAGNEAIDPTVGAHGGLRLAPQPAETCTPFPEASLDAEISPEFHAPRNPGDPVLGFADLHTHLNFPKAMGAVAMAGGVFHPYGIEHALADCSYLHGPNGVLDLLGSQAGPGSHETAGYPEFPHWPNRLTTSHVVSYYRWIERAYLSGLRLVVTLATGNPDLCQIASLLHPRLSEGDCSPASEVELQTNYIYEIQSYVDAQHGGPGKGWFRIVLSAEEAREVIRQNKLAVVLGVEYVTLFDCREGQSKCTPEFVDRELDKIYDLGIRSVFPIHRFDNAFGGTTLGGGSTNAWMNLSSKLHTGEVESLSDLLDPRKLLFKPIGGHFWEVEECPEGISGTGNMRDMNEFVADEAGFMRDALLSVPIIGHDLANAMDFVLLDKLAPLPS